MVEIFSWLWILINKSCIIGVYNTYVLGSLISALISTVHILMYLLSHYFSTYSPPRLNPWSYLRKSFSIPCCCDPMSHVFSHPVTTVPGLLSSFKFVTAKILFQRWKQMIMARRELWALCRMVLLFRNYTRCGLIIWHLPVLVIYRKIQKEKKITLMLGGSAFMKPCSLYAKHNSCKSSEKHLKRLLNRRVTFIPSVAWRTSIKGFFFTVELHWNLLTSFTSWLKPNKNVM